MEVEVSVGPVLDEIGATPCGGSDLVRPIRRTRPLCMEPRGPSSLKSSEQHCLVQATLVEPLWRRKPQTKKTPGFGSMRIAYNVQVSCGGNKFLSQRIHFIVVAITPVFFKNFLGKEQGLDGRETAHIRCFFFCRSMLERKG